MISPEELRNIPQKGKSKKLNFYERHQLRIIERKVKRQHKKKGKLFINISIILWRNGEYILETLKEKGYDAQYYYTRYTGHRLNICWEKK